MFHTQEARGSILSGSIPCYKDNAWLGAAHYFWDDEQDAVIWGRLSKNRTKYYDIYSADIDCKNVLDTVFDETHYNFWVKQIKKAEVVFMKAGLKPTLKQLNDYFLQKGIWIRFGGIMFQDISSNPDNYIFKSFQYKKRIQLAVYNTDIISNFAHYFNGKCV